MAEVFGGARPHALRTKSGTLAAATVLAGAGLLGVAAAGPELPGSPFAAVQHETALTAFPTFAESLQTLLDDFGMGDLNAVLGGFGTGAFTIDTTVADFLAAMNPDGDTLNGVAEIFGLSLSDPLYSTTVDSILGLGSMFLVDGVPIGNLDLGELIDVVLGDGAGDHSLQDLADAVGLGTLLGQFGSMVNALGIDNYNILNCGLTCDHPGLTTNSSLADWLSGILLAPTTEVTRNTVVLGIVTASNPHYAPADTLGEYLHTLPVSATDSTTMDNATLGLLFGMPPGQPWDEYVSLFPFGGTFLDPSGEIWGDQTLGTLLSSFLPGDSTLVIDGDTPITAILEAFGLLW
ncbi:hypothetical protein [Mycolicibacter senuensis]|uniref:hypothetical protein n=1 Tax=Mycolicibacter senuensis TaxID=386913 RepID=UPI000DCDF93E|nr:hypothetical protein [Mycolicibacter senuensis]RAU92341.1 hypothetical protein DQP56_20540 [Mycolicibacter senuensis]